jgi:hypothetical protein
MSSWETMVLSVLKILKKRPRQLSGFSGREERKISPSVVFKKHYLKYFRILEAALGATLQGDMYQFRG